MLPLHDDTRLSAQLSRGDVTAFNALYYKYYKAVYTNILRLVQDEQAAEDILQEVFETLWMHRKKIDHDQAVGGWLFVVSHNKALRFLKKAVREKTGLQDHLSTEIAEPSDPGEDDPAIIEYQYHLINEAIENLPPRKKQVFILCKLEGKTYEQAAIDMGISPHTVKEYVSASLQFVKEYSLSRHSLNAPLSLLMLASLINHL